MNVLRPILLALEPINSFYHQDKAKTYYPFILKQQDITLHYKALLLLRGLIANHLGLHIYLLELYYDLLSHLLGHLKALYLGLNYHHFINLTALNLDLLGQY